MFCTTANHNDTLSKDALLAMHRCTIHCSTICPTPIEGTAEATPCNQMLLRELMQDDDGCSAGSFAERVVAFAAVEGIFFSGR